MQTSNCDLSELPAFLRIPQDERRAAWKGRKLTKQGSRFRELSKAEEATTRQLRRELEAQAEAKKAARFAALRELRSRS